MIFTHPIKSVCCKDNFIPLQLETEAINFTFFVAMDGAKINWIPTNCHIEQIDLTKTHNIDFQETSLLNIH